MSLAWFVVMCEEMKEVEAPTYHHQPPLTWFVPVLLTMTTANRVPDPVEYAWALISRALLAVSNELTCACVWP